jgi:hypothetical protein
MVPAYLLSLLKQQQEVLKDKFPERFPHQWLVWEAGTWTAPAAAKETIHLTHRELQAKLRQADALSFGLRANGAGGQITIGRNSSNDIVINDATVSRHHAVLKAGPQAAAWMLEVVPGVKAATKVANLEVKAGAPALLRNGTQVKLGDAVLTFYDLPGLMERLRA